MKELKFVDVGEGITEGVVKKWLFKNGDTVKEDDTIVQIETDKAVVNIPAPISGALKIVAQENDTLKIGDIIAYVGDDKDTNNVVNTAQSNVKDNIQKQSVQQPTFSGIPQIKNISIHEQFNMNEQKDIEVQKSDFNKNKSTDTNTVKKDVIATPYVRKLARELNIDINTVVGTGPNGKVIENDVRNASAKTNKKVSSPKFSETLERSHANDIERIPLTQTRKAIARNMELSWSIPRASHMDLIDATTLFDLVKKEKENMNELGVKLTFLPFIIKATVEALKESPRFNSSYDHEQLEIIVKKYFNIGLAAEGPDGLKVVVIKDADKKSIANIAKEIQELAEKVKKQEVQLSDMSDSTFTITNIGSLGGGYLSVPMINYPEVAILGIHLIRDTPVVVNDEIVIRKIMPFSITFDHRVVDGADAVHFGNALKKYLEDPDFLELIG
ncbi:MAG: dihydrolipoamide acetyltransferase family protein [Candidatus Micrarchaeia archaeon]